MIDLFARSAPRWFTIASERPFLDDLARGLLAILPLDGEHALSDAVVLMPTRRAARSLAHSLLMAASAKALILPQIRVLGDLNEGEPPFEAGEVAFDLAPAISPWRRRFELAGLVAEHQRGLGHGEDAVSALALADALAAFLDSCRIEEVDAADRIDNLVGGDLAQHWRLSADFLNVALRAWPERLHQLGLMDVAERRVALLRGLAEQWTRSPPTHPVFAAGSTGSQPSSANLLKVIAEAPLGCVVLPGLDLNLADAAWREVGESHPQFTMSRLLESAGIERDRVEEWPLSNTGARGRWRRRLISEALRPPGRTADWLDQIADINAEAGRTGLDPIAEGLEGLSAVTARTEEEAATVAALLLREALAVEGKTAALISPDAGLARRVSARLLRWNITGDSSAGQPLAGAAVAVLAALIAKLSVDPADPVALLATLKHPFTRLGRAEGGLDSARRLIERRGLRGPRLPDMAAVIARIGKDSPQGLADAAEVLKLLDRVLVIARAPFGEASATISAAAEALTLALEALCQAGADGAPWSGQAGEALAAVLEAMIHDSDAAPKVTAMGFAELFEALLSGEILRAGGASHPRLQILGVLEARLVRADRLILAGLEEGSWPRGTGIDPFLSRPMRMTLGLPPPERRIGLSAHDFAQAACAPEVILLHTERRGGSPAIASRWLWRLRTLVSGATPEADAVRTLPARNDMLSWARELDAPLVDPPSTLRTATRPMPTPPVATRPTQLSVTDIERWVRDPYGFYARKILRLRPMERPDEPVEARARGEAVHAAFERFVLAHPDELPDAAHDRFAELLIEALAEKGMPLSRMARERTLAGRIAEWAVDFERRRRPGAQLLVERQGVLSFDVGDRTFTITAKADRIESRGHTADVLDFKTGQPPSAKMVRVGLAPQLTLTAAIVAGGGFETVAARAIGDLVYVRVSGGRVAGEEKQAADSGAVSTLVQSAIGGLRARAAWFERESTPYPSWAAPQFIGRFGGDYDHLARLWEWHVVGDGEGDAA